MKKILPFLFFLSILCSLSAQNNGLLFNGTDENLIIQHKPAFNTQENFTIEAWIYANAWKGQSWAGSIVTKDNHITNESGYAFRAGANGQLSYVMGTSSGWNEVLSDNIMNVEQWHHVAVTVGSGVMTLYIDGASVGSESYTGTINNSEINVYIGESAGFSGRNWDGIIDEVRMWNVTRTQAELTDNAATALTGTEPGLVMYLPMNEGTGNIAGNLVDAACSAAFVNMDDSNWVDGFTIPDYDISMNPVEGIDVLNMKIRPVKIRATMQNLGMENLSDVELTVNVDGTDLFTETIDEQIIAGEEFTYEFTTPVDLVGLDNPVVTLTAAHPEDQNTLNNSKSISISTLPGNTIRIFDAEAHNFSSAGQNQFSNILLPTDLSTYQTLLLHIDLACPAGGCDPWDQTAKVSATTDQGTFEIARYITPYGKACGPWTVDVTDFKEILSGAVTFNSFVQVWGPSGWLVTIDLEFVEGADDFPYYKTSPLWTTDYWVYGDPDINDDLDELSVSVDDNSETSHIRATVTGHGQGNTDNAAEFSNKTHQFQLNGVGIDNHNLWKADCAANTCDDQNGTWLFARAGWCPGQQVIPYIVETPNVSAGDNITLDYELESYTNLLNTGYNSSGHTEPHYRIWSYFVERSSQPYTDYRNLVCDAISPTITGADADQVLEEVQITVSNNGTVDLADFEISYIINNQIITTETISETLAAGATMTYTFALTDGLNPGFQNTLFGLIAHPQDENIGDDVAKTLVDGMTNTEEIIAAAEQIDIFPNPVQSGTFQITIDPILVGSRVDVLNVEGKIMQTAQINSTNLEMNVTGNGIYFLRFTHPEGYVSNKKLVVTK
jgi:hypothetical protein